MSTRWERITATRGRATVFFGSFIVWVLLGLLLTQPSVLGTTAGGYTNFAILFVWFGVLHIIETRWKRQDEARQN